MNYRHPWTDQMARLAKSLSMTTTDTNKIVIVKHKQ